MRDDFVIEWLADQPRADFSCGAPALDRYLREQASQDVKRLIANCFVLRQATGGAVAGYYTLAATSVPASELPAEALKRMPRYVALPAALVGRLAVDQRFRHLGLGQAMLADAALRVIRGDVKAFALVVDAKDEVAKAFYQRQGFISFESRRTTLFLPLATFKKAMLAKPAR